MSRKKVDVALIIPDASPVLTLARVDRLDLLLTFDCPVHIVDQVFYEITKPANDPTGKVKLALSKMHNRISIIETVTGAGFRSLSERNPNYPSKDLGEQAVSEYAVRLLKTTGPAFVPLVLFEDPDVLNLPIATMKRVHLLNTSAWIYALFRSGLLPDGDKLLADIDSTRATAMKPYEKDARTKKVLSRWRRKNPE